ncbi:MAG: hypothetical protein NVSMB65_09750 [Chloroflexota bacterium]
MKILLEFLLSVFLHPIAMILMWLNVLRREDLGAFHKAVWIVVSVVWGLGPLLYILVGGGDLW